MDNLKFFEAGDSFDLIKAAHEAHSNARVKLAEPTPNEAAFDSLLRKLETETIDQPSILTPDQPSAPPSTPVPATTTTSACWHEKAKKCPFLPELMNGNIPGITININKIVFH